MIYHTIKTFHQKAQAIQALWKGMKEKRDFSQHVCSWIFFASSSPHHKYGVISSSEMVFTCLEIGIFTAMTFDCLSHVFSAWKLRWPY